ncbi:MAG TPA: PAS domain S-box protein [Verrucomicrobiae bacterium]|nr:PAS domain S-box protein [Verrucomicrobiae bacterium]
MTTATNPLLMENEVKKINGEPQAASETTPVPNPTATVLLVDDEVRNLDVLESILQSPDYTLKRATTADEALMALLEGEFAVIVLDIQMPGMDGLQLANFIKQRKRTQHIPIIFLTAYFQEDKDVLQGYSVGAVDYLTKPVNSQVLRSKVGVFVDLFRKTRALAATNAALELEIGQRRKAEAALQTANNELEARVKARTVDLTLANHVLRESEERFRTLTNNAPAAIYTKDRNGRYTLANSLTCEILGRENVVGFTDFDLLPAEAAEKLRAHDLAVLTDVRPSEWEETVGDRHFLSVKFPLVDIHGRPTGVCGVSVDITERKQTEEALRDSEERFRTLASHAPVGIFMSDAGGRSVYLNQNWRTMAGLANEEALGFGWLKAVHPDDRGRIQEEWNAAVERGESSNSEFRFVRPDGMITWVQGNALQLRDGDGHITGYIGTVVNITDRKLAADALSEARNRLEERVLERTMQLHEKNNQLEEFVYSIAHDLRGPLRAMEACSHMLLADCLPQLDAAGQQYAKRINGSASFMDRLLIDLLEYGRIGHSELELNSVDVAVAWETAAFQGQHQIQEKHALVETIGPLPRVAAHEATLAQALANLLGNALRFVENGTRPHIKFRGEVRGETARLWVEDNGIGIATEHQERIFRVFERLHGSSYGGTGIGLSIVRKSIERMGGRVGVESEPGKGSRFWIELALAN